MYFRTEDCSLESTQLTTCNKSLGRSHSMWLLQMAGDCEKGFVPSGQRQLPSLGVLCLVPNQLLSSHRGEHVHTTQG